MNGCRPFCRRWGGNMRRSFLIAASRFHRAKGQNFAVVVLILLAACMLQLWLMLAMDYKQNFDRCHERLHGEDVLLAVDDDTAELSEYLTQKLESDGRTREYSIADALHMRGGFDYNGGEMNAEMVFLEKEAALARSIGRVEMIEDSGKESGVYLPLIYQSDDIAIGKTITITIGSHPMTYSVLGFFNSTMAGSNNCAIMEILLTKDHYQELETLGYAPKATLFGIRLSDQGESESVEAMLKNAVSAQYPDTHMASTSYALVTVSRYISQMICSGILSAMAFFILVIALVVIVSNIINDIQEHMDELGTLKAVGYTSRQLIASLFMQYGGIAFLVCLVGVSIAYGLFPLLNTMMEAQTGIPYNMRFLPLPTLLTLLILVGSVVLVVWLSAHRINHVDPIVALRQGISTHNFKRNRIPLDQSHAPLSLALALKTTLSGMKYNVTIAITMLALSLVVVFSGVMWKSMISDMTPFLNMIVGETADSCINVNESIESKFYDAMSEDDRVEKIYLYHSIEVRHEDEIGLLATLSDDFTKVNNANVMIEGRFPRYDNEIAIAAKYANETGLHIGSEMTITANGNQITYIITGLTQTTNNLGKDCLMSRAGYERLGELTNMSYYLDLREDIDIDAFNTEIKDRYPDQINTTINIDSVIAGSASIYVSLMTVLVIAILILSAVIITFVLYLLVRTMLNHQKRDYGIMKALGYTTGQLILQNALTFMPALIISAIIGAIGGSVIINPLIALFLSSIGIVKCSFIVPLDFISVATVVLILFAFTMACLLSLKIRKIAPRTMLTQE